MNHVARWDGTSWHAVGEGFNATVNTLTFDQDGLLYAGGHFYDADGDADYVAVWDGNRWSSLAGAGGGLNYIVEEMVVNDSGLLIAVGGFTDAGGDPDGDYIAVWNGSIWASLGGPGNGVNGEVYALAVDARGHIFVGGDFFNLGGVPDADYIAEWSGTAWFALGGGLSRDVRDLVFDGAGNLYATGTFSEPENHIAVWDGNTWNGLGSGLNSSGYALVYDGGTSLFVGGSFLTARGMTSNRIARWGNAAAAGLLVRDGFETGDVSGWSGAAGD